MNSLTKLALTGALIFGINSCNNKKELENQSELKKAQTELEKYNLENKQVYDDFKKFCAENPHKKMCAESQYKIKLSNGADIRFSGERSISFSILAKDTTFFDSELNGLDCELNDSYVFKDKKDSQIKIKSIKNMSQEEQLKVDKQYTNILRQILRDAGVPKY